ncbi:hypothetical protein BD289DRAFT_427917 [Coniella lustricola]|uniref:Uncharacterized protein n=1 Tax=Coniella lustricola TaxID=2025994 RepID=A0A2T3AEI8_9PEZI|nr:hypothetical protein BD289DRAFT_427917 [Coniella lustricola]
MKFTHVEWTRQDRISRPRPPPSLHDTTIPPRQTVTETRSTPQSERGGSRLRTMTMMLRW